MVAPLRETDASSSPDVDAKFGDTAAYRFHVGKKSSFKPVDPSDHNATAKKMLLCAATAWASSRSAVALFTCSAASNRLTLRQWRAKRASPRKLPWAQKTPAAAGAAGGHPAGSGRRGRGVRSAGGAGRLAGHGAFLAGVESRVGSTYDARPDPRLGATIVLPLREGARSWRWRSARWAIPRVY